ncbi:MAG: peptide chain release factor N(5)-glutamine methyltransferase [Oscillibacter sp.]|nr:peptide chain release factor N(5)-glutamine methyltransferase [Oscillibacter sp.]
MATTYSGLYLEIRRRLKAAGDIASDLAARELVCAGAGKSKEALFRDGNLYVPAEIEKQVCGLLQRHLDGEPVAYIIGEWEFYGLTLAVSPSVLIPRPDTETLVDRAVEYLRTLEPCRVLDLCAGCGCAGLAVASQVPDAKIVLADISDAALKLCSRNIWSNSFSGRVVPVNADALREPDRRIGMFQCVVCNPPYIASEEIASLDASVRDYEPRLALDGGADGLDFYRAIASKWRVALYPRGRIFFEVGINQALPVGQILRENGFGEIESYEDGNGVRRVVSAIRYPDIG